MKVWLIVNEFLMTNKFSEHVRWLMESAKKHEIALEVLSNAECLSVLSKPYGQEFIRLHNGLPDCVLFWDKDVRLARFLESLGLKVVNSAEAIALCDDKSLTHLTLMAKDIPMPKTVLGPMTYQNIGYTNLSFLDLVIETLGFPMVVKECFGSFGAQVYLANNKCELKALVLKIQGKPLLFQEFIKCSSGKDLRLQVVGDKVIACMYRYSENGDFRANITNGGSMKAYEPSAKERELAIKAAKLLKLDFAGVDLLFGEDGNPMVCEVNSNAHFKNIYDCTGVNTADAMMRYLLEKGKS